MCIPGMGTAMRELMAVPMQPDPVAAPVSAASAAAGASPVAAAGVEVQSGVARIAGVLWCTRHRHASGRADSVAVFVHPSSNFMGHYALADMAARGIDAVGMTTRYIGNESTLLLENCVIDIGSVIRHLRNEGYRKIILVGNSGGGGLVAMYQSQAEHPSISAQPAGGGPDLTRADLPMADALIMLMAHPGRSLVLTEKLDPAIVDEQDPFLRDASLDMFDAANAPPYSAQFLARFRAAQLARNDRITDWALAQLDRIRQFSNGQIRDLPFVVHGTQADPRQVDLSIEPSERKATTHWGPAYVANMIPGSLGHYTSLRSWLSQWSNRLSNGNGYQCLKQVSVPVHVMYGTADPGCYPSYAQGLYQAVPHANKQLTAVQGGGHYLHNQPAQKAFACDTMADWIKDLA